jgi:hypothetical protein
LVECEDTDAPFIDFAIQPVDFDIARSYYIGAFGVTREQAADGVADLLADQVAHVLKRFAQRREVLLVAAIGVLQHSPLRPRPPPTSRALATFALRSASQVVRSRMIEVYCVAAVKSIFAAGRGYFVFPKRSRGRFSEAVCDLAVDP